MVSLRSTANFQFLKFGYIYIISNLFQEILDNAEEIPDFFFSFTTSKADLNFVVSDSDSTKEGMG